MRILLDECVPRGLKKSPRGEQLVQTVPEAGLAGLKNGELLRRIAGSFDVFITTDKRIQHQQNLAKHDVAFVLLRARSNDISDLEPLVPTLVRHLSNAKRGQLLVIEWPRA